MRHILIDTVTGTIQAFDTDGEPIAESKPRVKQMDRKEWLLVLLALVCKTGIDRLEFLRGGEIEVVSAKTFFRQRMEAIS